MYTLYGHPTNADNHQQASCYFGMKLIRSTLQVKVLYGTLTHITCHLDWNYLVHTPCLGTYLMRTTIDLSRFILNFQMNLVSVYLNGEIRCLYSLSDNPLSLTMLQKKVPPPRQAMGWLCVSGLSWYHCFGKFFLKLFCNINTLVSLFTVTARSFEIHRHWSPKDMVLYLSSRER